MLGNKLCVLAEQPELHCKCPIIERLRLLELTKLNKRAGEPPQSVGGDQAVRPKLSFLLVQLVLQHADLPLSSSMADFQRNHSSHLVSAGSAGVRRGVQRQQPEQAEPEQHQQPVRAE